MPLFLLTAWFSVGYNHPDEHFQILEYCNYKLGFSAAKDLPWEFATRCRTSVQPFLAFCLCKAMLALGIFRPLWAAFLLRLIAALLSWWVTVRLIAKLLPGFATETGRKFFVACSVFLWFVPYLSARFSAENLSASLFLLAVSFILDFESPDGHKKIWMPLLAGCLLGFVFFVRVQMAFAMIGLGIWMLFIKRFKLSVWLLMIAGAVVAVIPSVMADHWMYGEWLFTPYLYFKTNLINHVAEKWGVFPWYYYIVMYVQMAIPPISIVLPVLFLWGVRKRITDVFSLITVVFLLGHFMIGHKEMRFLYPVSFAFTYVAATGLDAWLADHSLKPLYKGFAKILVGFNLVILSVRTFMPAQEAMLYFNFLYRYAGSHPTTMVHWGRTPYGLSVLQANFYRHPDLQLISSGTCWADFDTALNNVPRDRDLLFLSRQIKPEPEIAGYKLKKLYCIYPDWLLRFNIGDWEERSNIWTVYQVIR